MKPSLLLWNLKLIILFYSSLVTGSNQTIQPKYRLLIIIDLSISRYRYASQSFEACGLNLRIGKVGALSMNKCYMNTARATTMRYVSIFLSVNNSNVSRCWGYATAEKKKKQTKKKNKKLRIKMPAWHTCTYDCICRHPST